MAQKNTITGTQDASFLEDPEIQEFVDETREMAGVWMKGDIQGKDEALAVSLLEDCIDLGDTKAMLMLAKWCALGHGMEHNGERAEALVSDAAKKGNDEARVLLQLINEWKGKERINLGSMPKCLLKGLKEKIHVCIVLTGGIKGECTIERVALVMSILSCQDLNLQG